MRTTKQFLENSIKMLEQGFASLNTSTEPVAFSAILDGLGKASDGLRELVDNSYLSEEEKNIYTKKISAARYVNEGEI